MIDISLGTYLNASNLLNVCENFPLARAGNEGDGQDMAPAFKELIVTIETQYWTWMSISTSHLLIVSTRYKYSGHFAQRHWTDMQEGRGFLHYQKHSV